MQLEAKEALYARIEQKSSLPEAAKKVTKLQVSQHCSRQLGSN